MASQMTKMKYPIVVVNSNRRKRKTYMTHPDLEEAIEKANEYGCNGSIILHDDDGSEICDDEIFEYHLRRKAVFMICNKCSDWTLHPMISTPSPNEAKAVVEKIATKTYVSKRRTESNSNLNTSSEMVVPLTDSIFENSRIFDEDEDCNFPAFADYSIPWDKIPPFILELLQTGQPLQRKVNTLANFVIDDLRLIKPTLSLPVYRKIAKIIVTRFPKSFARDGLEDDIPELVNHFVSIMKNRYFNLTRTSVRSKKTKLKSCDSSYESNFSPEQDIDSDVKIEFDSLSSYE